MTITVIFSKNNVKHIDPMIYLILRVIKLFHRCPYCFR